MAKRNNSSWLTVLAIVVAGGFSAGVFFATVEQTSSTMSGAVFLGLVALPVAVNAALTNLRLNSGRSLLETIVERRRRHRTSRIADTEDAASTAAPAPGSPLDEDVDGERLRHGEPGIDDLATAYHRGFLDGLREAERQRETDLPREAREQLLTAAEWREIEAEQHRSDIRFAAWLGAGGAVVAALVGGVFLVIIELIRSPATP